MNPTTHIYLDNFRGFTETVFQLADVNFFVGENSTGKTSVLAVLNSIFSPHFWFTQRFNNEEHDFGGFKDMLSASAPPGSEFTIGVYQIHALKDGQFRRVGFIASFRDHEGLPMCSFFARMDNQTLTALKSANVDSYQFAKGQLPDSMLTPNAEDIFKYLENWGKASTTTFKDLPKKIPSSLGLLPLLQIAMALESEKAESDLDLSGLEMPFEPYNVTWLAPIRTRPHRTYDGYGKDFSPEGEHTPYVLRKRLGSKGKAEAFEKALKQFGKSSGLFKKVGIHNLGKGTADPFEIVVTLASKALRIDSVGYGVSQVLPLLVEILIRPKGAWFAIQQPEVHLHPKAQAALGDLIFHISKNDGKSFLIETHSDFTIDRFRLNTKVATGDKVARSGSVFRAIWGGK